jgi:hypothetical protein
MKIIAACLYFSIVNSGQIFKYNILSILVICQGLFEKDFGIYCLKKGALNRHMEK